MGWFVAGAGVEGGALAQRGVQLAQVGLQQVSGALAADGFYGALQGYQGVADVVQSTAVCLERWALGDSVCHVPAFGCTPPDLGVECCRDTLVLWGRKKREKLLILWFLFLICCTRLLGFCFWFNRCINTSIPLIEQALQCSVPLLMPCLPWFSAFLNLKFYSLL